VSQNNSGGWIDRDADSSSTALSGSLRLQATPALAFTLSDDYGYQRPERYFGAPTIIGQVDSSVRRTNYNIADADINYKDNWTQFNTELKPSPRVLVRNNLHALRTDRHWKNVENYTFQPATGLISRSSYIEIAHHQQQYGDRAEAIVSGSVLGRPNTVSAGFDYSWVGFENVSDTPFGGSSTVALTNPVPGNFINLTGTFPRYRTHTQQYSGFVEDRLSVTGKLSLVGGARVDRYDVDRVDLVATTTATRTFTPASWRGGVVYSVNPEMSVYAQYATANDAVGNFISQSPVQQIFDLTKGRQVEVGLKQSLRNGRVEWTVAGYQIVKKNLVVPIPGNPAVSQQVGQQSSRGVEATAAVVLGHGVRIDANGAVLQARFDDFLETVSGIVVSRSGNTPPSVPEQTANLWATWVMSSDWEARAGLRYVGDRFWNNADTSTAPSYTVVDVGVRKKLTSKLTVDARLFNAFDTLYATTFYGNSAAPQWLLGRPRASEVTLSVTF
jgi:iron complex outermembrane receptor protein